MTTKELIEVLNQYPQDYPVFLPSGTKEEECYKEIIDIIPVNNAIIIE
jgi:ADP-heptose:LPS heptosyltransferase